MEAHYVCIVFDWTSFVFFCHAIYSKRLRAIFFYCFFSLWRGIKPVIFQLMQFLANISQFIHHFLRIKWITQYFIWWHCLIRMHEWIEKRKTEARKITFIKEQITFMLTSYRNWAKSRRKWWMNWKDSKKITNYNTYTSAYMHKAHTCCIILRLCDDHHHRLGHKSIIWTSYSSIAQVICCQSTITSRIHIFSANNALFKLKHSFFQRIWRGKWIVK